MKENVNKRSEIDETFTTSSRIGTVEDIDVYDLIDELVIRTNGDIVIVNSKCSAFGIKSAISRMVNGLSQTETIARKKSNIENTLSVQSLIPRTWARASVIEKINIVGSSDATGRLTTKSITTKENIILKSPIRERTVDMESTTENIEVLDG